MKRIPIGVSNFEEIRTENYYFVDKSMLCADVVRSGSKVILLPRPRRFGKTLNLSMLKSFFSMTGKDPHALFGDLVVNEHRDVMDHCGGYPTIFLTFKDIKYTNFDHCFTALKGLLGSLYLEHESTLSAARPRGIEQKWVEAIINGEADVPQCHNALALLARLLHRATGKKVIVLVDEYDMPVHAGFNHGYYAEIIHFMRNLLSGAFKDNDHLEKGLLTGIMRIAKESIFSGFNNPHVRTILDEEFSQHFGFTQDELNNILNAFHLEDRAEEAQTWYNGYQFGSHTIYNPWSIMQYVTDARTTEAKAEPYWVNTSDNQLIRDLITEQSALPKPDLEILLRGETIHKEVETNIVLGDMTMDALWSMLTLSGYLTSRKTVIDQGVHHCDLAIPNREVRTFFQRTVQAWVKKQTGSEGLNPMLQALLQENMPQFIQLFEESVRQALSYHDTAGHTPERVYHVFFLGILIALQDRFLIRSNRESGLGRYDIVLVPRNTQHTGYIFEFKQAETQLQKAAQEAVNQIKSLDYAAELRQAGVAKTLAIGVAMDGKQAAVETTFL